MGFWSLWVEGFGVKGVLSRCRQGRWLAEVTKNDWGSGLGSGVLGFWI